MSFFIKSKPKLSLGDLLGAGIGKGLSAGTGEALKSKLFGQREQALALQKTLAKGQEPLTPFQKLSTELREKEQERKIHNSVVSELNTLSDIRKGVILADDVPSIASNITKRIQGGADPAVALQEGIFDYQQQRSSLGEVDVPKFKVAKAEKLREETINMLRENGVKNPSVIARSLKKKKWPTKEIQKIVGAVKNGGAQDKMPAASQFAGKRIRDTETGKLYKSDGVKWTEIK